MQKISKDGKEYDAKICIDTQKQPPYTPARRNQNLIEKRRNYRNVLRNGPSVWGVFYSLKEGLPERTTFDPLHRADRETGNGSADRI